ncbi:ATP-binding protein [Janthinobacterium sp. B9-8]|uniref:ATP-binding protein n=1 Tax=Janthinobacterium sp. B9-8 TaxID=1236179 RepID=UPI000AAAE79E|nr:ATP-binding protein [Janthinobacterium sp. B9-8]
MSIPSAPPHPRAMIPPMLRALVSVSYAILSTEGTIIDANDGFYQLLQQDPASRADNITPFMINPDFNTLTARIAHSEDGVLHRGILNFLDSQGLGHSQVGLVYCRNSNIELISEYDIKENEQLIQTVLTLNQELADKQRELVRANRAQARLLKKLEDTQSQLLQSEKMASIGQLAAGIAHEINNPIAFVSANLRTMGEYINDILSVLDAYTAAETMLSPSALAAIKRLYQERDIPYLREDSQQLLNESRDGLRRVRDIVQNLKYFSQIDQASEQMADLHKGLESTLQIIQSTLSPDTLIQREYGKIPLLQCHLAEINQVFLNLLTNATQAISGQGLITLRTGSDKNWVWIDIEDNGCGIPPELQSRVFEPFFTTRPVGSGTGLGLSLAWKIISDHGGHIVLNSTPDQGSLFRICLPLASPESRAQQ